MKYAPRIKPDSLPFEYTSDPNGTGILVEIDEDGFVQKISCIYKGVSDTAYFSHYADYSASYSVSGSDYDFEHREGSQGKVTFTPRGHENSGPGYDYEWSEWLEELFESFRNYRLKNIRERIILSGFEYLESASPLSLGQRVGDGLSHVLSFVGDPKGYMENRKMEREFEKAHGHEFRFRFGMPDELKEQIEMVLDKEGEDREIYSKFEAFWQQKQSETS